MFLWLTPSQAQTIAGHVRASSPEEACGLIGGKDGQALEIISITNIADQPQTHYEMHPAQQAEAMTRFYKQNLDLLAIYHSHVNSEPVPSMTDRRNATYPDAIYLIASLQNQQVNLAGWKISGADVAPVEVIVSQQKPVIETSPTPSRVQQITAVISVIFAVVLLIAYAIYLLPPAPPIPTPTG